MRIVFLVLILSLGLRAQAFAQEQSSPIEPPYVGNFAAIDISSGTVVALTRETPVLERRIRGFRARYLLQLRGGICPTRLSQDAQWIVRVSSEAIEQAIDPRDFINFYSLSRRGDTRHVHLYDVRRLGTQVIASAGTAAVPFTAIRHGADSFRIASMGPLPPGEYFLRLGGEGDSYCFGVDP